MTTITTMCTVTTMTTATTMTTILAMFALRTDVNASKVVSEVRSCDRGDEIIIGIDNTFLTPWVSNPSDPDILKKSLI